MDNNSSNKRLIDSILNSKDTKINKNAVEKAKNGDTSALINSLDSESKKKLNEALRDKNKAREILSSKEAKELLKHFLGGGKNG